MMTKAISIHIGLNRVDPDAYNGWDGQLSGCINDARAMQNIADNLGYLSILITDEEATADRVISEIGQAAFNLDSDGILFLTYSGHGGQIPDDTGDEDDEQDETWVLYDRHLIDDELYNLWSQFSSSARIVVLSDSCHSGSVTKTREYAAIAQSEPFVKHYRTKSGPLRFRGIPERVAADNYEKNKSMYRALKYAAGNRKREMSAAVLLISGCQDNQLSGDGDVNGLFTGNLLNVWNNGNFSGSYVSFHEDILSLMPATQTPNLLVLGTLDSGFEGQSPFTIDGIAKSEGTNSNNSSNGSSNNSGSSNNGGSNSNSWPSVHGPKITRRNSEAPTFQVNAGPNRYFVIEVATSPDLFNAVEFSDDWRSDNFYGSWSDSSPMQGSSYQLPDSHWKDLKNSSRLYYRVGSTASADGWDDYKVSNADTDGDSIPAILIDAQG